MRKWVPRASFGPVALGLLLGCSNSVSIPGDETLGTFLVEAHLSATTLDAGPVRDGGSDFTFAATLSRFRPDAGEAVSRAFVTVNGYSRDAGFDGQLLTSFATAPRILPSCSAQVDGGYCYEVQETFRVAVLSSSQAQALGGKCQDGLLDGGIPSGAGISPPASRPSGFDAVRICGELVDVFKPLGGCPCPEAMTRFNLAGGRKL